MPSHASTRDLARAALFETTSQLAHRLVDMANSGNDETAATWAVKLVTRGASPAVLGEVERAIQAVSWITRWRLDRPRGKFGWSYDLPTAETIGSREQAIAMMVVRLVNDDAVGTIRRCQLRGSRRDQRTCRRFFVGDPRAKWCSPACGSTARMRHKRMADRQ